MKRFSHKISPLFFVLLFFCCSAGAVSAQLCYEPSIFETGPKEAKRVKDVFVGYYDYYLNEQVRVGYYNNIFTKKDAKSCHELNFKFEFTVPGKKVIAPDKVDLKFFSVSNAAKYDESESRELEIFADDVSIYKKMSGFEFKTNIPKESYSETITAALDFKTFEKLAQAKGFYMLLGKNKIEFTAGQMESIRQMYALIEQK